MAGQYDDWLRELAAGGKTELPGKIALATRGMYWSDIVEIEGEWTGSTLEGTVRSSPDAPTALVTFAVEGPTIADGYTVFVISLAAGTGANSTGILPADSDENGEESFPFMLRFTPLGGEEELLVGGLLPVVGFV